MVRKTALITGAAKRLGAEIARTLHDAGYDILIHYQHSVEQANALSDVLNARRSNSATLVQADLLNPDDCQALVESVPKDLAVLVNNASVFYPTPLATASMADWDELLGVNLKAPFFLSRSLASTLASQQGCIVNITDIHAANGLPEYSMYSIAKAGLEAMTRVLAKEFAPVVRVNAVAPGAILWPEGSEEHSDIKKTVLSRIALERCGQPDDIAKAVLFLVDQGQYMTGQVVTVDGGRTLFS
ncbi:MAG: pteridine reductase [Methylococcales bacterium]|jgi:pteridine reductase